MDNQQQLQSKKNYNNQKQIKQKYLQLMLQSKDKQNNRLITFECMICFNQFNNTNNTPIIICENQHNMCKQCVQNKQFKKQPIQNQYQYQQQRYHYSCPLCSIQIQHSKIRTNNLLLQIYDWINQVTKRQNQTVQSLSNQIQGHKIVINKVLQQNKQHLKNVSTLKTLINMLTQENQLYKDKFYKHNPQKENNDVISQNDLIQHYEKFIAHLKAAKKQNQVNFQNLLNQEAYNELIFTIDHKNKHFSKFKIIAKNTFEMQGPFYRSFFQDYNFYYNIVPTNSIKMSKLNTLKKNQYIFLQIQLLHSQKNRIYFGLCTKKLAQSKNCHQQQGFIGLYLQQVSMKINGKNVVLQGQASKIKVKENSKIRVEIGAEKTVWRIDNQKVYTNQTSQLFRNQITQVYTIISMQMVGDRIKVIQ